MQMENYLNLGTIVLLKGGLKKIMIIGYQVASSEGDLVIYDYLGCLYPEGVFDSELNILFNHDQIERVYFDGYNDEDNIEFQKQLINFSKNKKESIADYNSAIQNNQEVFEKLDVFELNNENEDSIF